MLLDKSISFCIPAFNEEKYIGDCIKSIHAEMKTYNLRYEVIVIDNNCTDNTASVAMGLNTRVIVEKHPGVVWARQAGFKASKNNLLAFIDADARIPSGWVATAINSFYNNNENVAITGPLKYFDVPTYVNTGSVYFYKIATALHRFYPSLQGGNFIVKRSALEQLNGFDTSYEFWGEDTNTAIRLSKVGKVVLNPLLWVHSSGRRLTNQGLINTVATYVANYFSVNLFNRPISGKYKNFR